MEWNGVRWVGWGEVGLVWGWCGVGRGQLDWSGVQGGKINGVESGEGGLGWM